MNTGAKTFHERAADVLAKAKSETEVLQACLKKAEGKLKKNVLLSQALEGLGQGWRHERAGKYDPTWYFLRYSAPKAESPGARRISEPEMCWLAELADDPEEMRKGRLRRRYSEAHDRVPVAVATFEEITKVECPACKAHVPLVGCLEQTRDSYDGDIWETWNYALCLECDTLTELKHFADHT